MADGNEGNSGTPNEVARKIEMNESDSSIASNATVQFITGLAMIVLYFIFRTRAPWLYFPNITSKPKHPCYKYNYKVEDSENGSDENSGNSDPPEIKHSLAFLQPLFTLEDTKLLGMVGFDGFMLLQTIKLLYRIFLIIGIAISPLLLIIYKKTATKSNFFENLTISETTLNSDSLRLNQVMYPGLILVIFLITSLIYYLVFIYYKRYVTLRQLYLISPASLTSVLTLKKIQSTIARGHFDPSKSAIDFINVISNTVIFNRLPSYIKNDNDAKEYVKKLGVGNVKDAVLIKDTYNLQVLYEKRDVILQDIEKEINMIFLKMVEYYNINEGECRASFKEVYKAYRDEEKKDDSLNNPDYGLLGETNQGDNNEELFIDDKPKENKISLSAVHVFRNMKFKMQEKVKILNCFISSSQKIESISYSTDLEVYLEELRRVNERILNEKEKLENDEKHDENVVVVFENEPSIPQLADNVNEPERFDRGKDITEDNNHQNENSKPIDDNNTHPPLNGSPQQNVVRKSVNNTLFVKTNLVNDVSFFSLSQILNFKNTKGMFTLDIPINRKRAFVTFEDYKQSGIVKQSQIGTRVFSPTAEPAPAPNDVIWKNINRGEVSCFVAKLISFIFYVSFNIAFYFLVSKVVKMLQLGKDEQKNIVFTYISQSEWLRPIYMGILPPLVYNSLVFFVPIFLSTMINLEGIKAFSLCQIRLMYLYSMFLFYNAFLSVFFSTTFLDLIKDFATGDKLMTEIIMDFGKSIVETSVFFFNTIVQRACVGTLMTILKPSPFIQNFIISPFLIKTRRQEAEYTFSPPIDFGCIVPNVLLIFPMALAYSIISPSMIFLGFTFYFINYYVYKHELIYTSRNPYESGGIFWTASSDFLILGVVAFQCTSLACLYSIGKNRLTLFILVFLLLTDYYYFKSLKSLFKNCIENYPLNSPEDEFLDEFSNSVLEKRIELLDQFHETDDEDDEDVIPISEIGLKDKSIVTTDSYYKDPSTVGNISEITLPKNFFITIHFLRTFDSQNIFQLK